MRGGPLYFQMDRGIVTLVSEVMVSRPTPRIATLRAYAVHVIDDAGVRRLPIAFTDRKRLIFFLLTFLYAPLQYVFISRRLSHGQKRKR